MDLPPDRGWPAAPGHGADLLGRIAGFKIGREETYPGQTEDYEQAFERWRTLSETCDVFIASSNQFFDFKAKKSAYDAGQADAFVDPEGIRRFYAQAEAKYRAELARQNP